MFCKNCGNEIPEGSKVCPACGTTVESMASDFANTSGQTYNAAGQEVSNTYVGDSFNGNNQSYIGAVPLKTDRSLLIYILLSLVTCGIYSLFFIHSLAKDVNVACAGDGKETAGLLKLILLSIITCGIYGVYWYYSLGDRLHENGPRYGVNITETGTTILLWILIGLLFACAGSFVAMYFIIKNTNAICESYNRMNGIA
jgi:hypothetical protein